MGSDCTYFGGEDREFEEAMRGQIGTIFSSANGLDIMGSFKNVYWYWYYYPVYKKEMKFRPCLSLSGTTFYGG